MNLNEIRRILERYRRLFVRAYVYGSVAGGTEDRYSDVDLIIVRRTSATFFDRIKEIMELRKEFGAADIMIYTPDELEAMLAGPGRWFIKNSIAEGVAVEGEQGGGAAMAPAG